MLEKALFNFMRELKEHYYCHDIQIFILEYNKQHKSNEFILDIDWYLSAMIYHQLIAFQTKADSPVP